MASKVKIPLINTNVQMLWKAEDSPLSDECKFAESW